MKPLDLIWFALGIGWLALFVMTGIVLYLLWSERRR